MYVCQKGSKVKSQYITNAASKAVTGTSPAPPDEAENTVGGLPEVCDGGHSFIPKDPEISLLTPPNTELRRIYAFCWVMCCTFGTRVCRNAEMTERTSSPQQNVRMCDTRITW